MMIKFILASLFIMMFDTSPTFKQASVDRDYDNLENQLKRYQDGDFIKIDECEDSTEPSEEEQEEEFDELPCYRSSYDA